jgi:hypothetical protein
MALNGARLVRVEERLLGWVTGGEDGFVPWRPPTAQEEQRWDREGEELAALIERAEHREVSAAEADGIEALLRRLADEREAETAKMERTRRILTGGGTSHGKLPLASGCTCGVCEDWRR